MYNKDRNQVVIGSLTYPCNPDGNIDWTEETAEAFIASQEQDVFEDTDPSMSMDEFRSRLPFKTKVGFEMAISGTNPDVKLNPEQVATLVLFKQELNVACTLTADSGMVEGGCSFLLEVGLIDSELHEVLTNLGD